MPSGNQTWLGNDHGTTVGYDALQIILNQRVDIPTQWMIGRCFWDVFRCVSMCFGISKPVNNSLHSIHFCKAGTPHPVRGLSSNIPTFFGASRHGLSPQGHTASSIRLEIVLSDARISRLWFMDIQWYSWFYSFKPFQVLAQPPWFSSSSKLPKSQGTSGFSTRRRWFCQSLGPKNGNVTSETNKNHLRRRFPEIGVPLSHLFIHGFSMK